MLQSFESNSCVNFEHSDGNRRSPAYIIIQAFHHIIWPGKPQTDTQHNMFLLPFNSYFLLFLSFGPTENTRNPFFFFFSLPLGSRTAWIQILFCVVFSPVALPTRQTSRWWQKTYATDYSKCSTYWVCSV